MELLKTKLSPKGSSKEYTKILTGKIIGIAFSILISRTDVLGGLSPFSLPYILSYDKRIGVFIGGLIGIISRRSLNPYKYILINMLGICLSSLMEMIFKTVGKDRRDSFITFLSVFFVSFIFIIFSPYTAYDILRVLFESVLSFLSYFVIKKGINAVVSQNKKRFYTREENIISLSILTVVLSGLSDLYLPFDLSLKGILCILVTLQGVYRGGITGGARVAAFMGICAGIGSDFIGIFISTYAMCAAISSCFSKYGKITTALAFTVGNIIMSIAVGSDNYTSINFYELTVAAGLFFILPDFIFDRFIYPGEERDKDLRKSNMVKELAMIKLERLSIAFLRLSETVSVPKRYKNQMNLQSASMLFEAVGDKVCRKCALRFYCWQKDYDRTVNALQKATDAIKEGEECDISVFPDYFSEKCLKKDKIISALTGLYEIYRLNYLWKDKLKENAKIHKEQFKELAEIVSDLKYEIEGNPYFDEEMEGEIASRLEAEGFMVKQASVMKDSNENLTATVILFPCQSKDTCIKRVEEILSEVLLVPFFNVSGRCSTKECKLVFKEKESYFLKTSIKKHTKPGSEISGDSSLTGSLENATRYVVLCDGSGSGKEANALSEKTIRLLTDFLKTGFSRSSSVRLINSALFCNEEDDRFSTVDLSITDLKTGETEFIKKGACPTYIKHANGEYRIIRDSSLPLGIVDSIKENKKIVKLREGDIFVSVSDGVTDCIKKDDWIIDALKAIKSGEPEQISDCLMKIALTTNNISDDMTVIVSRLDKVL